MKIVITGGRGQLGAILKRALEARGDEVIIVGRPLERWAAVIDGCDAVINLAGRSVNCRYSERNLAEMMSSRVDSTRAVGEGIAKAVKPPRVWLQMSTATLYAHRFDAPNDEATGLIGGSEPDVPELWRRSVDIAKAWERALDDAPTPRTRKVCLRTAMVMSRGQGGVFDVLLGLTRRGLGGRCGDGRQYVSWIHEDDFARAVLLLLDRGDVSGAVNLASANPLPNAEFMRVLRQAAGRSFGLPAARWMLELGAFFMRTETELLLKSRRVVPGRLLGYGFEFHFPEWPAAAAQLVRRASS